MKQSYILLTVFISLLALQNLKAQTIGPATLNSTGGTGTVGSTIVDWSIGEMTMVSTYTTSTVIVTQGLLQPADGYPMGITNINLAHNLQVFPNPANSIVNLQYTSAIQGLLNCKLMDMTGKIIITKDIQVTRPVTQEQLNVSELAAATYLLEISYKADNTAEEKTAYKIEKLK